MRVTLKDSGEALVMVHTNIPLTLQRRLKMASVELNETMQSIIARAIERELTEQELSARNNGSVED